MLSNQSVRNEKPRAKAAISTQGASLTANVHSNSTPMLKDSKSRYEKGMELYKSGRVSIGFNGLFKVSGFQVDTEKMQCECPNYKTRKEACKHLFAAMLFVKNRGKRTVEGLDRFNSNGNGSHKDTVSVKEPSEESQEAHSKDFDRSLGLRSLTRLRRY